MISIKNLKGGQGGGANAVANYCEHELVLHQEVHTGTEYTTGYYRDGSTPSAWHGAGAAALGLAGRVDRDDLVHVLEGRLPDGSDLTQRGHVTNRRLGVDLTISAPKSVSLQALAGGDERMLAAHDRAVAAALDLVEREVLTARRGKGGLAREVTGSLVAATYRHEDARPVAGHVDPQLHTHCLLANATQRADGTWSAMDLQFGEGSVLMHLADAHYKNELARALQAMGYRLRRTGDGFELGHISDEQIARFSQRRGQIDAALAARGLTRETSDATDRVLANLATREDKTQGDQSGQRWVWRQEAREAEIVLDRPAAGYAVPYPDLSSEAVKSGTRHLAERETVFRRDAVRLEALKAGMGDTSLAGVDRAIEAKAGGLLDAGGNQFTTRDALHREQEILQRARAGQGQASALMTHAQARDYLSERELAQGFAYSDGQRQALVLGLTSTDSVTGIVGAAGAGKTTAMKGLVDAAHGRGLEVIGIAPSAKARNELESAGAETNRTVASFLACEHDYNEHRWVILDEAGMVSAKDMDALMRKLDQEGGRLVLVGDPRQLKAVEAGEPFAQLIETGALAHATIDEIQRQVDPDLRALAQAFARGDASSATCTAMDYTVSARVEAQDPAKPTVPERRLGLARTTAEAYLSLSAEERAQTLVLSGTHAVRQQVNAQIRAGLQERGAVSRDEIAVRALDKAGLTREKATQVGSYRAGMVVRFEAGKGRERHTTDYPVDRIDGNQVVLRASDGTEKTWDPAREKAGGVYVPRDMNLAQGDQIIFRENQGKGDDGIVNGQTATIQRVERDPDGGTQVTARLDDGREVSLDPSKNHSIDYGWCRTVHSAQGATVDRVIVAGEASRVATAETAYVACSRERESLQIVTDDPQRLQKSWETWADTQHALTAAGVASRPDLAPLQALRAEAAAELGREGDLAAAREVRGWRQPETPKIPAAAAREREPELER